MNIDQFIQGEEQRLNTIESPSQKLGLLTNLFEVRKKSGIKRNNYVDFKKFIDLYIEVVKSANFGYDDINSQKVKKTLGYLELDERIAASRYAVSVMARELPEHDRSWLIKLMNEATVQHIFHLKQYRQYPKAFAFILSNSFSSLLIFLFSFFILVNIILLPAHFPSWAVFKISYENYSPNFYLNHILNVLTLFSDLDNNFKIIPLNWIAVLGSIASKIIFLLIIVNFIYRKLTDKIKLQ